MTKPKSLDEILDKCFEDICYAFQSDDYSEAKVQAKKDIQAYYIALVKSAELEDKEAFMSYGHCDNINACRWHKIGKSDQMKAVLEVLR